MSTNYKNSTAFYMSGRMISIKLLESEEVVKGRVFLYDDGTKTLILKLWDDQL